MILFILIGIALVAIGLYVARNPKDANKPNTDEISPTLGVATLKQERPSIKINSDGSWTVVVPSHLFEGVRLETEDGRKFEVKPGDNFRKMTGHRSEELERYKHFSPEFMKQTTGLIAGRLTDELEGTFWGTGEENEKAVLSDSSEPLDSIDDNGGADGARTRDLQRDRLAF